MSVQDCRICRFREMCRIYKTVEEETANIKDSMNELRSMSILEIASIVERVRDVAYTSIAEKCKYFEES